MSFHPPNKILIQLSESNDLILMNSLLEVLDKKEGIKTPNSEFTIHEQKYRGNTQNFSIWFKGNHQASLVRLKKDIIEEKVICPLFGNSDNFGSCLPLKALVCDKTSRGIKWVGEFYKDQKYHISFKNYGSDKVSFSEFKKIVPEGEFYYLNSRNLLKPSK